MRRLLFCACVNLIILILAASCSKVAATQAAIVMTAIATTERQSRYGIVTFLAPPPDGTPYQLTFTQHGLVIGSNPSLSTHSSVTANPTTTASTEDDPTFYGLTFTAPYGIIAMNFPLDSQCPSIQTLNLSDDDKVADCYADYLRAHPVNIYVAAANFTSIVTVNMSSALMLQTAH